MKYYIQIRMLNYCSKNNIKYDFYYYYYYNYKTFFVDIYFVN